MRRLRILFCLSVLFFASDPSHAIDFFFLPDTAMGEVGQTVLLSGQIGPSDTLRGFTIYMMYDTNEIDLVPPPTPGSLIAGREGLDFRWLDHVPAAPFRLEIGATVFSEDYWAGPGELFQVRFELRACADVVIVAEVGFRRPDASFIPGDYNPPAILICGRVPEPPSFLTIHASPHYFVTLHWSSVTRDTMGRMLLMPPDYLIYRQSMQPPVLPILIATTDDTLFVDSLSNGAEYLYYLITQTNE